MTKFGMSSRFFWMIITAAIFAIGLWGFTAFRNSNAVPRLSDPNINQSVDTLYLPVDFETASISGSQLVVSGTATGSSVISLYHGSYDGRQTLLVTVPSTQMGRWNTVLNLAQINNVNSSFSIELLASMPDGTVVRSTRTLFVINGEQSGEPVSGLRPAVIITEPGGPTLVLQSPFGDLPQQGGLTLESIEYDNSGGVIFTGTTKSDGVVRVFANAALIGETGVSDDGDGRWILIAGSTLPVGAYDITIVWHDPSTGVQARFQVPFERLSPDDILDTLRENDRMSGAVFSDVMWQLSRELYGGGRQQTVLYSPLILEP